VAGSLSPRLHNRGLAALGLDAVYLPFLVDELASFFRLAELLRLQGLSVTIPHKEGVLPFLAQRNEAVQAIGACNTLLRAQEGWRGENTDAEGFLSPLGCLRAGSRAVVLGAGGAARAIVYALRRAGLEVLILNRTAARAERLAAEFGCRAAGLDSRGLELLRERADLIVQATSAGMEPEVEADPLPEYRFRGGEIVYDIVYKPPLTRFLKRARRAGCRVIPGLEMLLGQGRAQFKLFTGREYPQIEL